MVSSRNRDKIPCYRVVPPFPREPFFVYTAKDMLKFKNKPEFKVQGPFLQWMWIRDHKLTPGDLKDFEFWAAREIGVRPHHLVQATQESRRALMLEWYNEVKLEVA